MVDREPVFATKDGKTTRLRDIPDYPPMDNSHRQLARVASEVERALAPPATRLEALARLLVELPYGEFVEMSAGIAGQGKLDSEMPHRELSSDLARLIHAWAEQTLRAGGGR
jgi:hypothetical protein